MYNQVLSCPGPQVQPHCSRKIPLYIRLGNLIRIESADFGLFVGQRLEFAVEVPSCA